MDYRLPGMDGVEATVALRAACPERRVVCLTARRARRELEALQAAGAVACLRRTRSWTRSWPRSAGGGARRREADPPEHGDRARLDRATSPRPQSRFPNWRVVPLYVRFGDESFRDYVDLGPHEFYERLAAAPELPTTSQPTPQDFLAVYEELAGYERIFSLHISAKLSGHVRERDASPPRRWAATGPARRHRDRLGRDRDARARHPAPARARHDRRGDRRARRALSRGDGGCSSPSTRSSTCAKGGRIGRARRSRASC